MSCRRRRRSTTSTRWGRGSAARRWWRGWRRRWRWCGRWCGASTSRRPTSTSSGVAASCAGTAGWAPSGRCASSRGCPP
ncbi:hypothetical protein MUK42_16870 [Musa troglodytarum]|uniref:Uncharacterized protein n=1 Tax=Musa troglodytarum TaxID=320322 RepID=A0A9E7KKX9_9LILI|nr:hypothetical protein MUK42_16870 [Musa troglodytarum]